MPEEKHPIDRISKGEGYICNHCHTEILKGEEYYHFRRRTGWYKSHSDIQICDKRREYGTNYTGKGIA